ncbi:TPA: hypothetical protein ACTVL7_001432 [Escherichia coli]|uniref:hypothetical protein n=1 Tax=Escherichia coli TaxID=562 RepID=UPI0015FC109F|nr:hypothetical protein [Escherichia coli]EFB1308996.1 hypothetical protein [Escherichia coli]MCB6152428.1 hypothetical protein [Escherichia coli]MCX3733564.1 hypothetical protein [Escherichia coli]MDA6496779.1 hypothetical protein [Escherichia coli]HCJ6136088.1 hypothetical protein [Escherichia coli]
MTITKLIQTAILFIAALITIQTIYSPVVEAEQNSILLISKIGSSSDEWNKNITPLTHQSLWDERDAYDASHILMVPMHFAFVTTDTKGIEQFEHLMSRFAKQELPGGQLNQAQWMYFVTRYLALKTEFNYPLNQSDSYLLQRTAAWLHNRWMFEPAYQWGQLPLIGTKSRMKLIYSSSKAWPLSYYPIILDYELFLFSAASDIEFIKEKYPETIKLYSQEINSSIEALAAEGIAAVRNRGTFTSDGGWLFQMGMWADHPDYRFAGQPRVEKDMNEKRISNIAEDSSHSSRWPLFFRSMISAAINNPEDKEVLLKAYHGYSSQFSHHVAVIQNKSVFLNNYMDGRNGVYRYKYSTTGKNDNLGYGPYALSGVLGQSWYPFLSGVDDIYNIYEKSYPLSKETIDLYIGPNTTRKRNPLFVWPQFFTNGFAELIAKQSSYISKYYSLDKNGLPHVTLPESKQGDRLH